MGLVVGVDPGASGALALLDPSKVIQGVPVLLEAETVPSIREKIGSRRSGVIAAYEVGDMLHGWQTKHGELIARAAIERVHTMPGDFAPQAFAFGRSLGKIEGVLEAMGVVIDSVPVAVWRQRVGVRRRKEDEDAKVLKRLSRERACELWPEAAEKFKRVKDSDRAEAALIGVAIC